MTNLFNFNCRCLTCDNLFEPKSPHFTFIYDYFEHTGYCNSLCHDKNVVCQYILFPKLIGDNAESFASLAEWYNCEYAIAHEV